MAGSVALYTLGCKLNFSESSTIARQLAEDGFRRVEFQDGADLYVINTCSVTDHADRKCKKVVREALKHNPKAFVVIVGCYAQLKPEEIAAIPGVDMVLGAAEKFNLREHILELSKREKAEVFNRPIRETNIFIPAFSAGDRTRTFLKVQDGCDYFCTFCTIPLARGRSRSETIEKTMDSAREAVATGVKEIVLTGVNLGDFGKQNKESFFELIRQLDRLEGIERFRISSIEPNLLNNDIIAFVKDSQKFVPHFHIPLQSGSDKILGLMRRRYRRELYAERVNYIKDIMPHCSVGVDVITGFPGETEEDFLDTYNFINELPVSYLHVFPYSERINTKAAAMPDIVPVKERHRRGEMLRILSEKKKRAFYDSQADTFRSVLFEAENEGGMMSGFTENYVRVNTPYDPLLVNEIVGVKLKERNEAGEYVAHELIPLEEHQ